MFVRYSLRTTDAPAARAFYRDAIGLELPDGAREGASLEAWPLHEQARARGAPAHWLGHARVNDVDAAFAAFVARGATTFGPIVTRGPARYTVVRDPHGAIVSLGQGFDALDDRPIAWHQLHATDRDASWALYADVLGWRAVDTIESPELERGHLRFAWSEGGAPVGSVADTARWEGVHPHWLFYLPARDLDVAVARVRALGGSARDPVAMPRTGRLAACEDPQGAAFGLFAR